MSKQGWTLVVAVVLVCACAIPSFAQKPFLDLIRKKYQLDNKNGKCDLCHEKRPNEEPGAKNLNVYGKAIAADPTMKPLLGKTEKYKFSEAELAIVDKVITSLEKVDSDGDGASNREELELGTFPGDPKSTPDKKALAKYRKDHPDSAPVAKPK
ncbi:MAG TPA: thrombospondin type 3 repeat-containing protein [Planctomycetota bacterium]|nr:thrombospondin type 3 repeat-containing protein [Planctomycetota bacterium]